MSKLISELLLDDTIEVRIKKEYQNKYGFGKSIVWNIVSTNYRGYQNTTFSNTKVAITDKIIAILAYDAKEPENPNGKGYYKAYGRPMFNVSNISKWLNSLEGPNEWYTPFQYDEPPTAENLVLDNQFLIPTPYLDFPGFLSIFDESFSSSLIKVSIPFINVNAAGDTLTVGGVFSNIFLPSTIELGLTKESSAPVDGYVFQSFNTTNKKPITAKITQDAINFYGVDATADDFYSYHTRTIGYSVKYRNRSISTIGGNPYTYPVASIGIRPVCCFNGNCYVSDEKNENGHYVLEYENYSSNSGNSGGSSDNEDNEDSNRTSIYIPLSFRRLKNSGTFYLSYPEYKKLVLSQDLDLLVNKVVTITGNGEVGLGKSGNPILGVISKCEFESENPLKILATVEFKGIFSNIIAKKDIVAGDFIAVDGNGGIVKSETYTKNQVTHVQEIEGDNKNIASVLIR